MFMRMFIDPNICIMFFFHTKWYRIYSINWINCQIIQYMELWNYYTQVSLVDWSWWNFAFILRHHRILWSFVDALLFILPFSIPLNLWNVVFFPYFFLEFLLSRFSWRKKSFSFLQFSMCFVHHFCRIHFCFAKDPVPFASPSIQFLTIGCRFSHWSMLQTYIFWTINS